MPKGVTFSYSVQILFKSFCRLLCGHYNGLQTKIKEKWHKHFRGKNNLCENYQQRSRKGLGLRWRRAMCGRQQSVSANRCHIFLDLFQFFPHVYYSYGKGSPRQHRRGGFFFARGMVEWHLCLSQRYHPCISSPRSDNDTAVCPSKKSSSLHYDAPQQQQQQHATTRPSTAIQY